LAADEWKEEKREREEEFQKQIMAEAVKYKNLEKSFGELQV
jgi:hypothetical protein